MIILITLTFMILLLAPLIGSTLYYKKRTGKILSINQEKIRDARYFGKSFSALIEKNLAHIQEDTIPLSRPEQFIDGDMDQTHKGSIDKLVIARESDYRASQVDEFTKEIYGGKNIILEGDHHLEVRAVYSKGNMIVGSNTHVVRWLDAEGTLAIYDDCDLGLSTSSRIRMSIGERCKFRRLYAPEIRIGQYPEDPFDARDGKNPMIYNMPVQMNRGRNIRYISNEMINDQGIVYYTVLAPKNLNIAEGIIIQGDVRSNKGVRLNEGAVVCGNIFAEKDVYLGKNTCVLGSVFSQENIYFEEGAVVGQTNRICSVIARGKIVFAKRNFVFGYISCEEQGLIVPEEHHQKKEIEEVIEEINRVGEGQDSRELRFLGMPIEHTKLRFKNLYEYEHVDQQGFRFNKGLEEVIIPKGATTVPKSMFFNCKSLHTVILPWTLQKIEAYSFGDCSSLKDISLTECSNLEEIGVSAFENCESLVEIEIPASVEVLSGAAFSRCISLKRVEFEEDSKLTIIGDHCFRGCESLEEIRIPKQVKTIGVSAFRECEQLTTIILPETCKDEKGVLEMPEEKLQFYKVIEEKEPNKEPNKVLEQVKEQGVRKTPKEGAGNVSE